MSTPYDAWILLTGEQRAGSPLAQEKWSLATEQSRTLPLRDVTAGHGEGFAEGSQAACKRSVQKSWQWAYL